MRGRDWAMLLALAVLWGGSFLFVGIAVDALPPMTIVVLRVGLAAAVLMPLVALRGHLPGQPRTWLDFAAMGLLNNVLPFTLIVWGQAQIASGLAAILNATTPIFTVLVAHAVTDDERLTPARSAGVLLGFAGVAVVFAPDLMQGIQGPVPAMLAILAAALSYAFAGIFGRRFRRMGVAPEAAAAGQVAMSALMLLPVALGLETPWRLPMPGLPTIGAIVALALLSTALAYLLYFRILASVGATNLLLVTFLIPPVAILLGVIFLDESLRIVHLAGLSLIIVGLATIDGRALRSFSRRRGGGRARLG